MVVNFCVSVGYRTNSLDVVWSDAFRHFTARERTMPSQDVYPSVCPSVTRRYCTETAKPILNRRV